LESSLEKSQAPQGQKQGRQVHHTAELQQAADETFQQQQQQLKITRSSPNVPTRSLSVGPFLDVPTQGCTLAWAIEAHLLQQLFAGMT
jgi:hypothetical protein